MNIGEILTADCANGLGMRVSVFVSGCLNHCKGCFQPQTWEFDYGIPYDGAVEQKILDELAMPYYDGLTILGGEPFEIQNQETVAALIGRVKKELPARNIWMYTGYTYDRDLVPGGCRYTKFTDSILDKIDILVDGRFMEEKKNLCLKFRGSENQRIIDMRQTRAAGKAVLSPLNN